MNRSNFAKQLLLCALAGVLALGLFVGWSLTIYVFSVLTLGCCAGALAAVFGRPDEATRQEASALLEEIRALLDDFRASWAWDTLGGIQATIGQRGYCTEAQQRAVRNIAAAVQRQEDDPKYQDGGRPVNRAAGSRRYEGFGRGRR